MSVATANFWLFVFGVIALVGVMGVIFSGVVQIVHYLSEVGELHKNPHRHEDSDNGY